MWGRLVVHDGSLPAASRLHLFGCLRSCVLTAVYARHYVCEITLLRPSLRDRTKDNLRVVTHTFSGGYTTNVYRLDEMELGAASQGYRRFR